MFFFIFCCYLFSAKEKQYSITCVFFYCLLAHHAERKPIVFVVTNERATIERQFPFFYALQKRYLTQLGQKTDFFVFEIDERI